jgi:hypothetical protein
LSLTTNPSLVLRLRADGVIIFVFLIYLCGVPRDDLGHPYHSLKYIPVSSHESFPLSIMVQKFFTVEPLITDTAEEFKFCPL